MPVDASDLTPQAYPWPVELPPLALLQGDGTVRPLAPAAGPADGPAALDEALASAGAAPRSERRLLLTVGSLAAPQVLAERYERASLCGDAAVATGLVAASVTGLAVGHSAHASRRGYVPAAPYAAPGVRTELRAIWVSEEQLAALDATQPNYERLTLPAAPLELTLAAGEAPAEVEVYASRHGVIGRLRPLPLHISQQQLFERLAVLVDPDPFEGPADEVCARLAADPGDVRALLASHGLDIPDGLSRS